MPILKSIPTEFSGVTANVHEIVSIRDNLKVPEVCLFVHSYADVGSMGGKPLMQKTYVFNNVPVEVSEGEEPVVLYPYYLTPENLASEGETHVSLSEQALLTYAEFEGGTIV